MHIKSKRFALVLLLLLLAIFPFTGCYDLGDGVEDDTEYCTVFENIVLYNSNGNKVTDYDMEDFYNPDAVNSFSSPIAYEDCNAFTYLAIRIDKDLSIGEFAVHINATSTGTLKASVFLLDNLPSKIKTKTNDEKEEDCDEPSDEQVIAKVETATLEGESNWVCLSVKSWTVNGTTSKLLDVKSGQYLVFRFDNNVYDIETRILDKIKNLYESLQSYYLTIKGEFDEKNNAYMSGGSEYTSEEIEELRRNVDASEQEYKAQQSKYERAQADYDATHLELESIAFRITAILINTEKRT